MKAVKIEVVGKSVGCAPCYELKMLLKMNAVEFSFYEASMSSERSVELKTMMADLGVRSIPAVFVDGMFFDAGPSAVTRADELFKLETFGTQGAQ